MEIWDLYDSQRKLTGKTMVRGDRQPEDAYRIIVHICLFNTKGEMLIQKRQPFKDGWRGMWDISVGGSAVSGDDSQTAAHRELLEELGLDFDFNGKLPALTTTFRLGFDDFYLFNDVDVDLNCLHLQETEVEKVAWADREEILKLIAAREFMPYHPDLISLLFYLRDHHDDLTEADWTI